MSGDPAMLSSNSKFNRIHMMLVLNTFRSIDNLQIRKGSARAIKSKGNYALMV